MHEVPPKAVFFGYPAKPHRNAMQEAAMLKFLTENHKALRKLLKDQGGG